MNDIEKAAWLSIFTKACGRYHKHDSATDTVIRAKRIADNALEIIRECGILDLDILNDAKAIRG